MYNPVHIGRRLRALRESLDPPQTQEEFGAKLLDGRSRQQISKIETGKANIRLDELLAWLVLTKKPPAAFFGATVPDRYANPNHARLHERVQAILSAGPEWQERFEERLIDLEARFWSVSETASGDS